MVHFPSGFLPTVKMLRLVAEDLANKNDYQGRCLHCRKPTLAPKVELVHRRSPAFSDGGQSECSLRLRQHAPGVRRVQLHVGRKRSGGAQGGRIEHCDRRRGDRVIEPDGRYRVAANSFLADGGSGFSVLEEGTLRTVGEIDVDALVAYFARAGAVASGAQDRNTRLN